MDKALTGTVIGIIWLVSFWMGYHGFNNKVAPAKTPAVEVSTTRSADGSSSTTDYVVNDTWGYKRVVFTVMKNSPAVHHISIEGKNGARVVLFYDSVKVEVAGELPKDAFDWTHWSAMKWGQVKEWAEAQKK